VSVGTLAKTSLRRMNNRSTGRFTEDYEGGSGRSAERTKGDGGEASPLAVLRSISTCGTSSSSVQ
jgi:hypothetical protein